MTNKKKLILILAAMVVGNVTSTSNVDIGAMAAAAKNACTVENAKKYPLIAGVATFGVVAAVGGITYTLSSLFAGNVQSAENDNRGQQNNGIDFVATSEGNIPMIAAAGGGSGENEDSAYVVYRRYTDAD